MMDGLFGRHKIMKLNRWICLNQMNRSISRPLKNELFTFVLKDSIGLPEVFSRHGDKRFSSAEESKKNFLLDNGIVISNNGAGYSRILSELVYGDIVDESSIDQLLVIKFDWRKNRRYTKACTNREIHRGIRTKDIFFSCIDITCDDREWYIGFSDGLVFKQFGQIVLNLSAFEKTDPK